VEKKEFLTTKYCISRGHCTDILRIVLSEYGEIESTPSHLALILLILLVPTKRPLTECIVLLPLWNTIYWIWRHSCVRAVKVEKSRLAHVCILQLQCFSVCGGKLKKRSVHCLSSAVAVGKNGFIQFVIY
jgi:hypothetical protein